MKTLKVMFGAGCFWGIEEKLRIVEGVIETEVGYAGGHLENPTEQEVHDEDTGHTEVAVAEYNPEKITYEELLDIFWKSNDPTQVNREGPNIGYQYRSVIFYYDDNQKAAAEKAKKELESSGEYNAPIATAIEPVTTYFPAADFHQQWLLKHGLKVCPWKK